MSPEKPERRLSGIIPEYSMRTWIQRRIPFSSAIRYFLYEHPEYIHELGVCEYVKKSSLHQGGL
jgi:hypothetical protein